MNKWVLVMFMWFRFDCIMQFCDWALSLRGFEMEMDLAIIVKPIWVIGSAVMVGHLGWSLGKGKYKS